MIGSYEILRQLISFDTVSRNANIDLIDYMRNLLAQAGIESTITPNADGTKANLLATIGPTDIGGVMLSGHTDVVPIDGQNWTKPAFSLTEEDGKYFGRGTTDMKGFVACAIRIGLLAQSRPLKTPLHLAFSYDEEIGCCGVRSMIDLLRNTTIRPSMCIVGEPTSLHIATGHKGKIAQKARFTGREGHSALAPFACNAVYLACDFINILRELQQDIVENSPHDHDYAVPYTTIHAGKMAGGVALNIVPNHAEVDFEIRNIAEDDSQKILTTIHDRTADMVANARQQTPEADISFETLFSYPGLKTTKNAQIVEFVQSLTGTNNIIKVPFGTEGGLFQQQLDIPTVVCGPGSMDQGHKPDEYIEIDQMQRCDAMLDTLLDRLESEI